MIAAVAVSACATTRTAVTPIDLAQQAGPLLQDGRADVTGIRGTVRVSADEVVEVRVREGDLERPVRVSVRDLVRGCVEGVTSPGCLAGQSVDAPVLERRRIRFDRGRASTAIGFGLIGGVIGVCLAACDGDADLGKGAAVTGGVALGAAALFLLVVIVGGR